MRSIGKLFHYIIVSNNESGILLVLMLAKTGINISGQVKSSYFLSQRFTPSPCCGLEGQVCLGSVLDSGLQAKDFGPCLADGPGRRGIQHWISEDGKRWYWNSWHLGIFIAPLGFFREKEVTCKMWFRVLSAGFCHLLCGDFSLLVSIVSNWTPLLLHLCALLVLTIILFSSPGFLQWLLYDFQAPGWVGLRFAFQEWWAQWP